MINHYPYTDLHELNLDYILRKIKELRAEMTEFEALNTITFAGVWSITDQYPKWTLVDNNADGYLALQPVPAGIDISNTDYWLKVVNYSSIYADFDARLAACEDILKKGFDTSGKWLFLGDSYANSGWISTVINVLGINDRAFNEAVTGHAFNDGSWLGDFTGFIAGRTDLDEFKHIVIGGGLNDATPAALSGTTLATAITAFCTAAHTYMPNAKIEVAFIGNALNDSPYLYGRTAANIAQALTIYKMSLPNNNACYLSNTEFIMHNYSYFDSDHLHPNSSGAYRIAMGVINAIMTGSCSVTYWYEDTSSVTFGDFTCYGGYRSVVNNEFSDISINLAIHAARTLTWTLDENWHDLGQLPNGIIQFVAKPQNVIIQVSTNNTTDKVLCAVKIEDRHLYIMNAELNGYSSYGSISLTGKRVDLGYIKIQMPTLYDSQLV